MCCCLLFVGGCSLCVVGCWCSLEIVLFLCLRFDVVCCALRVVSWRSFIVVVRCCMLMFDVDCCILFVVGCCCCSMCWLMVDGRSLLVGRCSLF